jgi:hypothetical protein
VVGSLVMVADMDGYLHFLDSSAGAAARVHAGGGASRRPRLSTATPSS